MSWWNRAIDEHREVFVARDDGHARTYSLPIWRVNELLKNFMTDIRKQILDGERPRIAIAGWLDYMWLRAAVTRPWENETAWRMMPMLESAQLNLPNHFQFQGVTVFEGKNETGWVFA